MASSIWQRKGNATCTTLTQRPRYKTWCWRHPFNPCLFSVGTTQYQFTFYNGDPGAVWLGYSDVSQGSWYWWFYNLWSLLYISIIYDTLGAFKNKALVQEYCFMQREERFSNATASPVLLRYKHPIMNYSFYVDSEYKTMPLHHLNLIKPGSLIEKELPKKSTRALVANALMGPLKNQGTWHLARLEEILIKMTPSLPPLGVGSGPYRACFSLGPCRFPYSLCS